MGEPKKVDRRRQLVAIEPLIELGYIERTSNGKKDWPFQVMCRDRSVHSFREVQSLECWAGAMFAALEFINEVEKEGGKIEGFGVDTWRKCRRGPKGFGFQRGKTNLH
jgi:hypothetical protein